MNYYNHTEPRKELWRHQNLRSEICVSNEKNRTLIKGLFKQVQDHSPNQFCFGQEQR